MGVKFMSFVYIFLSFISFTIISFFVAKNVPEHQKQHSFLCSISLISTIIYILTFSINFFIIQKILFVFCFLIVAHELYKNKGKLLKEFFTAHKLFFMLSLCWFFITYKIQILNWDDFSWGSFVKYINHYGTYWTSEAAILKEGLRYFPGLSLWETFFTGQDIYSEQPLFFAIGLICISTFYALRPAYFRFKETALLFVFFCAAMSWFTNGMATISTELSIACLLATGIFSTLELKKVSDLFVPFSIALFLAITKETGFLLALLIVLLVVIRATREKQFFSKWTIYSIICFIILILNYQLWQWYLRQDPNFVPFNTGGILEFIKNDLANLTDRTRDTLNTFFSALHSRTLTNSWISRISLPGFKYISGTYLVWTVLLTMVLLQLRKRYEYGVTFYWGLFGYSSVLLVNFLYVSGEYEGRYLASYERYIGLYFLAFTLVAFKIILIEQLWKNKIFLGSLVTLMVIFPPNPRILFSNSSKRLLPTFITSRLPIKFDNSRVDVEVISTKIQKQTSPESKIWFIWQNSNGFQAMVVRYEIVPRKMNAGAWSVGEKYYEGDVWTANYQAKDLRRIFSTVDYVALGFVDDKFIERFREVFTSTPKSGALYKTEILNNTLQLVEI